VLDDFENRARGWIATYRTLLQRAGVPTSHLACKLQLRSDSTFEEAHAAAEDLRREWGMGEVPAAVLVSAIEREMGARVLFVDAPRNVSGAAVYLPGLPVILVNRTEAPGRRNFDIAHELFHLLTWDAMTPERVEREGRSRGKGNRVERLAENFAGALLMPASVIRAKWDRRGEMDLPAWLISVASTLGVTAVALKWRLVVLGILSRAEADGLADRRLASNGDKSADTPPLLFDRELVARVHDAVEEGYLSFRRAMGILGTTPQAFRDLCAAYGLTLSYEV
jgi:Zn-dependent peptidase ImmA (M78 family)